ncbi:hypothetical protein DESUT3_25810 [Desulfuromonas versatilis]|uniref:DNA helicase PriA n=1 Tax=Desulfuromonas versatilis TaxID=2802975 RepID=A0ABM8HXS2_9BACT|nr:hypothetical protein DESUT3_25810 [Desulfuromonas versatilis]
MICGFCGKQISLDSETKKGCGGCPMSGGCHKICCPHCGYENPAPPRLLKRWLKADPEKGEK